MFAQCATCVTVGFKDLFVFPLYVCLYMIIHTYIPVCWYHGDQKRALDARELELHGFGELNSRPQSSEEQLVLLITEFSLRPICVVL